MSFYLGEPDKLENKYRDAYSLWKRDPSPANSGSLLRTIKPEIDKGISIHVGKANPLLKSHARRLALQAVNNYDPHKAKLSTHVINHLQSLKRLNRQEMQVLPVPERVSLEQNRVRLSEQELTDKLGREPSLFELSDHTGLSPKRLAYIRKFKPAMAEGTFASRGDEEGDAFMPAVENHRSQDTWAELVYGDLEPINQKIMEWTLGLHDQPVRSNKDIAFRLGITPGAVSQRKAKIQALLDEGRRLSPF